MSTLKSSKQRDAVLANLQSRYDLPTAEDVFLAVREVILSISLATVYRNLKLLESEGLIESYTGKGSFVSAQNPEMLKEQNLREIEANLQKAVDIAKRACQKAGLTLAANTSDKTARKSLFIVMHKTQSTDETTKINNEIPFDMP